MHAKLLARMKIEPDLYSLNIRYRDPYLLLDRETGQQMALGAWRIELPKMCVHWYQIQYES